MACFDQDTRYGKGIILHVSLYLKEKKKYRRKVLKKFNNMLHMGKEAKKQLKPLIYKDFEKLKKKRNGLCAKIAKKTVQNRKKRDNQRRKKLVTVT